MLAKGNYGDATLLTFLNQLCWNKPSWRNVPNVGAG